MFNKNVPATGIGLFRLLFGLVTLQEVIFLLYFNHLIFDPIPFLDVEFPMIPFFLCVWAVIAVFITLGYHSQQAIIANYLFWIIFVNFTPMQRDFDGGFDLFMIGSNFFLIFMPIDKAFSLDNLRRKLQNPFKHYSLYPKQQVSMLAYNIPVMICLGFLYFDSAVHKLFAEHWRNGLGAWLPATMPYYISPLDFSWFLNNEILEKTIGYAILVFQFTFVFFFYKRCLRPVYLFFGMGLHLGITLILNIYPFGLGMLCFYSLVFPLSWYKKMATRLTAKTPQLTVFYDEQCPLCSKTILTLNHFDIFNCINFQSAQTYASRYPALNKIELSTLLTDLYALDQKDKLYDGVRTYALILIKMRYTAPFGYFLLLPGIDQIANKIYRNIADTRSRISCDQHCDTHTAKEPPATLYDKIFTPLSEQQSKRNIARICKILLILLFFQLNSTIHYGLIYRFKLNTQVNALTAQLSSLSNTLTLFSNTFLGITPHALYLHDHFAGYNRLLAITYYDANGQEKWLPFVNKEGRLVSPNWGRVHSMWANIAVTPHIDNHRLSKLLMKVTAFWGIKSGLDLNNTTFNIKLKKISVPFVWTKNLLHKNLSAPWTTIGTAKWQNKDFVIQLPENINKL